MSEFDFPALGDASAPYQTRENLVTAVRAAIDVRGDALQNSIDAISGGVLVVGEWAASSGAFPTTRPGGAAIQIGDAFVVTAAGTVDSVAFSVADRLIAIRATGGATYSGNWVLAAYSELLDGPIAQSLGGTGSASLKLANGVFATAAALQAATVPAGVTFIRLEAYHSGVSGGAGWWAFSSTEPSHSGKLQSADNKWWELQPENGAVSVRQLGAKGDNSTNDAAAFTAAHTMAAEVVIPAGEYIIGSTVNAARSMRGVGPESHIKCSAGATYALFEVKTSRTRFSHFRATGSFTGSNNVAGNFLFLIDDNLSRISFDTIWAEQLDQVFDISAGFHVSIDRLFYRNIRTYIGRSRATVGVFYRDGWGDQDGDWYTPDAGFPEPTAFWLVQGEGHVFKLGDNIHPGSGIIFEPSASNIEWCIVDGGFVSDSAQDTSGAGIIIRQSSDTHYIRGIFIRNVWLATNERGLIIDGDGTAGIDGVFVTNSVIHNNRREGVVVDAASASNIVLDACEFTGNNSGDNSANDVNIIRGEVLMNACKHGRAARWVSRPAHYVYVHSTAGRVRITHPVLLENDAGGATVSAFRALNNDTNISLAEWTVVASVDLSTGGAATTKTLVNFLRPYSEIKVQVSNLSKSDAGAMFVRLRNTADAAQNVWQQRLFGTTASTHRGDILSPDSHAGNDSAFVLIDNHKTPQKPCSGFFTRPGTETGGTFQGLIELASDGVDEVILGLSANNITGGTALVFVR